MPALLWGLSQKTVTVDEAKFLEDEGLVYDTYHPEHGSTESPGEKFAVCGDVDWTVVEQALHDFHTSA